MVVVVEAGVAQAHDVVVRQHAERHAGFHAEAFDALDHGDDGVHVAGLGAAPGGTHAVARGAGVLGLLGFVDDALHFHELGGLEARLVMRRLAAVAAIFRAAAGLDREQAAHLHGVGIEMRRDARSGRGTAGP